MTETCFTDTELNLEILSEEANEIIEVLSRINRMKSKIARFGLDDYHPKNRMSNKDALEEEIGHFEAMRDIQVSQGVLSENQINIAKKEKQRTLENYYFPMRESNIETLTCALCGKKVQGRQWPKRNKGSGVCSSCINFLIKTCFDKESIRNAYGDEGYHYNIKVNP